MAQERPKQNLGGISQAEKREIFEHKMSGSQSVQSVDAMIPLEESLLSLEKLDRTSPELWPEQKFGSLTASGLIAEVKRLHDVAYQLGLEEAKEMTRGKYLNVLTRKRR
ncbi:Protein lin-52 [Blattella germanica]|nr:Protein lin-52 [Blattella germanica]